MLVGLAFVALFTRFSSPKTLLRNPIRATIFERIRTQPGCTIQALADDAGIARMCVVYHLRLLRRMNMVRIVKSDGKYRVYPPGAAIGPPVAGGKTQLEILAQLRIRPSGCSRRDLAQSLPHVHRGSRNAAIQRLIEMGLVEEVEAGQERILRIVASLPAPDGITQIHYHLRGLGSNQMGAEVASALSRPIAMAEG